MLGAPRPQGNVPALTTPTRRGPPGVSATIGPPLSPMQVVVRYGSLLWIRPMRKSQGYAHICTVH